MDELKTQEQTPLRAALYVDGFNLYHPIHRMGPENNYLKWSCLWQLGEQLCAGRGYTLVKVVFCTAVPTFANFPDKHQRHIRFNSAQRARGVTVIEGHYVPEDIEENGIATGEKKWTEKQTDLNVSHSLLFDGIDDVYDVAFLLSADTDQIATARTFTKRVAPLGKAMIGVAPPDRRAPIGYSNYKIERLIITKAQIEASVMPGEIPSPERLIIRPPEYDPPSGWVHPHDRALDKPPPPPKKDKWSKGFKIAR